MQVVLSHAMECTFIKKRNSDNVFLYVIVGEIRTSIKISVVPPRLIDNKRTVSLCKEAIVIDGA